MYSGLQAAKIVETLTILNQRIYERFPGSGLSQVCEGLVDTSRKTARRARLVGRPFFFVRLLVLIAISAAVAAQIYVARTMGFYELFTDGGGDRAEVTQALESVVNLLIAAGIALWFLLGLEQRLKRRQVLNFLHELRSFAHVVDMHQLTKDPTIVLHGSSRTKSSPERTMSEFELARYLDYCSEMLALTGKLAALYSERTRDTEIVAAVNDVETLTTNLGRKIWQKIMLIGEDAQTDNS